MFTFTGVSDLHQHTILEPHHNTILAPPEEGITATHYSYTISKSTYHIISRSRLLTTQAPSVSRAPLSHLSFIMFPSPKLHLYNTLRHTKHELLSGFKDVLVEHIRSQGDMVQGCHIYMKACARAFTQTFFYGSSTSMPDQ
jgi:hypothetical protein